MSLDRIIALHDWYCRNVMPMRRTPEVERLWLDWIKAGYNGPDLRDVIRYIRRQIALGKRNEGALKLSNLIARGEVGFIGFDQDLGLARSRRNLNPEKKLEPAPDAPAPAPEPAQPEARQAEAPREHNAAEAQRIAADLARLKRATES